MALFISGLMEYGAASKANLDAALVGSASCAIYRHNFFLGQTEYILTLPIVPDNANKTMVSPDFDIQ